MKDLLQTLNETFDNKYSYLRLGKVDVSTDAKRVSVTFLLPEEVYNYSFSRADMEDIKSTVTKALGGNYQVFCRFEKIFVTEDIIKNGLIEYMEKHFPLIAANIDYALIKIRVLDDVLLHLPVPENIHKYMKTVDFEGKIRAFLHDKYFCESTFEYELLPDEISTKTFEANSANRYGKTVQVSNKRILFGKEQDVIAPAVHISTLKGDGQDVICCGKIKNLKYYTRDESKRKEGKRFYRNYYTFSINDTTGYLNIFINLDGQIPLLAEGADVICRGRVNLRDDMTSFGMYARAVALCDVPYEVIREQTKPLGAPEEYSILEPKPYEEVTYAQLTIGLESDRSAATGYIEPTVTAAMRVIKTDQAYVPYEVAMCRVEGDKIIEYIHTFLKVNFTEESERAEYANSKGYASPRFASVIPDLVKFSDGKTIVAVNPPFLMDLLNGTAKPIRYQFTNETRALPLPTAGDQKSLSALDEAIELAKILLGESVK